VGENYSCSGKREVRIKFYPGHISWEWITGAQNRVQWRALVSPVISFIVP
jgi:hypothetical protein